MRQSNQAQAGNRGLVGFGSEAGQSMMAEHVIFVVSGGKGASGSQALQTALAQFDDARASVTVVPEVRTAEQIMDVVLKASAAGALVVHTLVDPQLRATMTDACRRNNVSALDLMGPLLQQLAQHIGHRPLGQPGRYRRLREEDLTRIEAIEFTVEHDDGKRAYDLDKAEIVLVGPSRVGKTPVSIYLATLGWKVANVPLAREMQPPDKLFEIDKRRIVGLRMDAGQLVYFRRERGRRLGFRPGADYSAPVALLEELEYAESVFRKGGFHAIDMTDKPIEEAAEDVIATIQKRLK